MPREPRSGNHPRDPFRENSAPLDRLKEMGVLMGRHGTEAQDATRLTLGCIACCLRRDAPINAYGIAVCTALTSATTGNILKRLHQRGFFAGLTVTPHPRNSWSRYDYQP